MKIKRIEPIAVSLPMKKPVFMAGVEIRQADNVLVRIEADNGMVGWGEAASAPTMTGETVESMMAAVLYLDAGADGPAGRGHRRRGGRDDRPHVRQQRRQGRDRDGAARSRRPRHQPAGPRAARRQAARAASRSSASSATASLPPTCATPSRRRPKAFAAFKIKVGIDKPMIDGERTRRICELLGPRPADLRPTPTRAGAPRRRVQYVRAVAGSGLDFFEQPVLADDIAGMAAVAAAADCAIGADESIHSLDDIRRHHERKAARGVSLKTIKLGGMRGVMAAGLLCEQLGMAVNVSCKTGESSIACAAAMHVAAALPQIAWGLTLDQRRARRRRDGAADSHRARPCGGVGSPGARNRRGRGPCPPLSARRGAEAGGVRRR